MGLAEGRARIDHYVFGGREGIGVYEERQVVSRGKAAFACYDGIAFPSDGQLARDLGDEMVVSGSAPKDEMATGDIGFVHFIGFLDWELTSKEFSPAFLKVSDFEGYPSIDELITRRMVGSDYEKTGQEGVVDGTLQTVSLPEDVGR